jgi:Uri superfamily endonuclease
MTKGVYVLTIWLSRDVKKRVGSLGEVLFEKGLYAYVGSAQNNLDKRINRHLSKSKKVFWHIDHLLDSDFASVPGAFVKEGGKEEECRLANSIKGSPVHGFGCSDCKCGAHLFRIDNPSQLLNLGVKPVTS